MNCSNNEPERGCERMPKVAKEHPLIARMKYDAALRGISDKEIATAMRRTERCLSSRKNEPEKFLLGELEIIAKKLKITITIGPDGTVSATSDL